MEGQLSTKAKNPRAAIDNRGSLDVQLDFSFMELTDLEEILSCEPRAVGTKGKQMKKVEMIDGKYHTKSVKLCNNSIADIKGIPTVLTNILVQPEIITWIDLSFNDLPDIDACLCDFRELQILYLHGNKIANLSEVDKLAGLPMLKKLTLHGNPIDTDKYYKWYVLTQVPHLTNFDFSGVTKADRQTAKSLSSMTPQRKKRSKPKE